MEKHSLCVRILVAPIPRSSTTRTSNEHSNLRRTDLMSVEAVCRLFTEEQRDRTDWRLLKFFARNRVAQEIRNFEDHVQANKDNDRDWRRGWNDPFERFCFEQLDKSLASGRLYGGHDGSSERIAREDLVCTWYRLSINIIKYYKKNDFASPINLISINIIPEARKSIFSFNANDRRNRTGWSRGGTGERKRERECARERERERERKKETFSSSVPFPSSELFPVVSFDFDRSWSLLARVVFPFLRWKIRFRWPRSGWEEQNDAGNGKTLRVHPPANINQRRIIITGNARQQRVYWRNSS